MQLELLLTLAGTALFGAAVVLHFVFARALRRPEVRHPAPARYPSITVIRPVRGRDVDAERNFAAALETGYPGPVETIFVFDDEGDPGVAPARAAIRAHQSFHRPGEARILFCGQPPASRTGKLHAMIVGMAEAQGELVAFGDSDTRPDAQVLRVLVESLLADPRHGSAFAPVVVVSRARTLGDVGYQLMLNALYGPPVARVAALEGGVVPFIMGQLMVFRREALDAIGGLASAEGQLVDDMFLGMQLTRAGFCNVMVRHPLPIINSGTSFHEFVQLVRRWMLLARTGIPHRFSRPMWFFGIAFWLGLVLTALALVSGHPLGAIAPAATVATLSISLDSLQHRFGGPRFGWRLGWFSALLFVIVPPIFVTTRFEHEVSWRGRAYPVSDEHRLDATTTAHVEV
jgi:ceramide glucosyltransferase